jgi:hypothetical protein
MTNAIDFCNQANPSTTIHTTPFQLIIIVAENLCAPKLDVTPEFTELCLIFCLVLRWIKINELIQIQISEMQQAYIDAATHSNMHKSML